MDGRHMANLRRKDPPNEEEIWVGRVMRFRPRPTMPFVPLARPFKRGSVVHAKMKLGMMMLGPDLDPSIKIKKYSIRQL